MTARQYAAAGVDLNTADAAKEKIGHLVAGTRTPLAVGLVGAFGGMVRVPAGMRKPVLVLSTDGVGTKVLVALEAGRFDTVGEDLVNHSVNDILVHAARPIAFMDYIAGAGLTVGQIAGIVEGIARGCRNHNMALAGGETAQMPGLYQHGHYDLAGTIIGVVEEDEALHGDHVQPGDVLLGYASTGLHTNGYTLARKVLFETMKLRLNAKLTGVKGTLGEELLLVHRNYQPLLASLPPAAVKGLAHITGGGLVDNLPRVLPKGCDAVIDCSSWDVPAIFDHIQRGGKVDPHEMYQVFNMGIGMTIVVAENDAAAIVRKTKGSIIGGIVEGSGVVRLVV